MNVISMMHKIDAIPNSMICESALPNFGTTPDDSAEFVRIRAFDQLDSSLDGYVVRRSQQQMNMLRHDDERVQFVSPLATISIDRLQENPDVHFDDKQFTSIESRERHEISSGRGEEASRLQRQTSAAESRASFETLNWHEWNSCPSRLFFASRFSFWEEYGPGRCGADSVAGEGV
jgi:hypothetical protein